MTYDGIHYPGEVTAVGINYVEVMVMHPTVGGKYKWPAQRDKMTYPFDDVVKKIGSPVPCSSRAATFTFPNFHS